MDSNTWTTNKVRVEGCNTLNNKVVVFIGIKYKTGRHVSFVVCICVCVHAFISVYRGCLLCRKERKYRVEASSVIRRVLLHQASLVAQW